MGISMGTFSVRNAGRRQVQGVEGLILINPPFNVRAELITIPILIVTHEKDNSSMKTLTAEQIRNFYYQSPKAEIVIFSGGVVGSGPQATHLTQKYQHGLRGLETEFVQTVVQFIDDTTI